MGMAAIGIALFKYVMKYSPENCEYFNRDRFILSNGTHPPLLPEEIVTFWDGKLILDPEIRPCVSVAVSLYALGRCQEYDCGAAQELPLNPS